MALGDSCANTDAQILKYAAVIAGVIAWADGCVSAGVGAFIGS